MRFSRPGAAMRCRVFPIFAGNRIRRMMNAVKYDNSPVRSGAGSMVFLRWEGAAEATASLSIMRRKGAGYTYTVRRKGRNSVVSDRMHRRFSVW